MSQHKRPERPNTFSTSTIPHLRNLLLDLHNYPHPTLASPPNLKRRASVALVIRIRPHYRFPRTPFSGSGTTEERINAFFTQSWVEHGDPEILFIKRASNERDKWNGHIAFPGGRRDPEDADDYEVAVREAWEEVGIDLRDSSGVALSCGNLSQAVITASWGETPLMVFCPYVFLVVNNDKVTTRLQPSEVASTHWVPVRSLLDPKFRTYWEQDVSSRTSRSDFGMKRAMHRLLTGSMLFAAVRLHPSESVFATEALEYLDTTTTTTTLGGGGSQSSSGTEASLNLTVPLGFARSRLAPRVDTGERLLLWGLTLSVVGDFLDMLPPHDALRQFVYPTFTAWDVRLWVWILSWNYRNAKAREAEEAFQLLDRPERDAGDMVMWAEAGKEPEKRYFGRVRSEQRGRRGRAAFDLLPGYYPIIRKAAVLATAIKAVGIAALVGWMIKKWKR
jgi:8-oxo-dGTP pyrophosphatase MutT (NUDIX family)